LICRHRQRTKRCTRAGGNVGFEVNVKRARRVNLGVMPHWLTKFWEALTSESSVPPPPFKASKRTATIMYGLWYGRLTPQEAREKAIEWGFSTDSIDRMIADATAPPSYWSKHLENEA